MEPDYITKAATPPIEAGASVWILTVCEYDEPDYTTVGVYTSEAAASQAYAFAMNASPNHTSGYVQEMALSKCHEGGKLRVWGTA